MKRSVFALAPFLLLTACGVATELPGGNGLRSEEVSLSGGVKRSEFIHGYSGKGALLIESLGQDKPEEIAIRWEGGSRSCAISAAVARSWSEVRDLASQATPDVTEALALNPNRSFLSVVLAFGRQLGEREYEVWYIEGQEQMTMAVESVWRILDECKCDKCEVDVHFVEFGPLVGTGVDGLPIHRERRPS